MGNQTSILIKAIKSQLKAKGITYKELAEDLAMSEANIKRMFAQQKINLDRLELICNRLNLDLLELVQLSQQHNKEISELTLEQEKEILSDKKMLLTASLCLSGWRFNDMLKHYDFTEVELIGYLTKLDKIKFIELLPYNQIRKKVSSRFSWQPSGPIQKFFTQLIQKEFFESSFTQTHEKIIFISGMLSDASNKKIQKMMEDLALEYRAALRQDKGLSLDDKKGTSLVLGLRDWELSVFNQLRKKL